jgi:capsular polysaccharide biosynthesis protein
MANHYATALNATPSYGERFGKKLLTLTLIAIPLGFLLAGVIAYVMPRKYESRAVVQVNPSHRLAMTPSGDLLQSQMTPQFFATQFEVIRSQATLAMVAEKLNLANRWNTSVEDAIVNLSAIVHAQNIRGTDLIEINVMHPSPEDARDIAQGVYEAYKARRLQEEQKISEESLQQLIRAIADQQNMVNQTAKAMEQYKPVPTIVVEDIDPAIRTQMQKNVELLSQAKNDGERMLLAGIMLDGENPLKVIYLEYLKAGEELEVLCQKPKAETDPQVVAKKKRIEKLSEKLKISLSEYMAQLQTQLAACGLGSGSNEIDAERAAQYDAKLAELNEQQRTLNEMKQQFAGDEINAKQPQNIIELHEQPVIAKDPLSPKVNRMLLLGGTGLPLAVLLLGLPLTAFIHLVSRR